MYYINSKHISIIETDFEYDEDDYSVKFNIIFNNLNKYIEINLEDKNIDKIETVKIFKETLSKLIHYYTLCIVNKKFIGDIKTFTFDTIYLKDNTINLKK